MTQEGQAWRPGDDVTTDTHKLGSAATLGAQRVSYFNRNSPLVMIMYPQKKYTSDIRLHYADAGENNGLPKWLY